MPEEAKGREAQEGREKEISSQKKIPSGGTSEPKDLERSGYREESKGLTDTQKSSFEMAAIATSAAAQKEIEAGYILALRSPRNKHEARTEIYEVCEHSLFAQKALYAKPVGKEFNKGTQTWEDKIVVDFSIRFAEQIKRIWGNIKTQSFVIFDAPDMQIRMVTVTDLEHNISYSETATIEKAVERRKPFDREVLSERAATDGHIVYRVRATEEEVRNKSKGEASKIMRNNILRLIPEEILENARLIIRKTRTTEINKDLGSIKDRMVITFATLNISVQELESYIGKSLEDFTGDDVNKLGTMHVGIAEGSTTWEDCVRQRQEITRGAGSGKKESEKVNLSDFKPGSGEDATPVEQKVETRSDAATPGPDRTVKIPPGVIPALIPDKTRLKAFTSIPEANIVQGMEYVVKAVSDDGLSVKVKGQTIKEFIMLDAFQIL